MTNLQLSPTQVKEFFLKGLKEVGYPVESVEDVIMYPGGAVTVRCELDKEKPDEVK